MMFCPFAALLLDGHPTNLRGGRIAHECYGNSLIRRVEGNILTIIKVFSQLHDKLFLFSPGINACAVGVCNNSSDRISVRYFLGFYLEVVIWLYRVIVWSLYAQNWNNFTQMARIMIACLIGNFLEDGHTDFFRYWILLSVCLTLDIESNLKTNS